MELHSEIEAIPGDVTSPRGFRAAGVHCGIKESVPDLALVVSQGPATVAGVFTTNRVQAAPVRYCRRVVAGGSARAILVNSGNANACTGRRGILDTEEMAALVGHELGLPAQQVLVASTGVIGVSLPMSEIRGGIPRVVCQLEDQGSSAAEAILTTDSFTKTAAARFVVPSAATTITIGGMAKGAGMIHPDMATTLCFLTTDAAISADLLRCALREAMDRSFNSISVDGETSTNDTALLLANGQAGGEPLSAGPEMDRFTAALTQIAVELAKMVVKDGEGATKLVEIEVEGASLDTEARRAARTVARSLLVKTAFYGGQPNWGRVVSALGQSGVEMEEEKIELWFNDLQVVRGGVGVLEDLERAAAELQPDEFRLRIGLGMGPGRARVWTCDLGEEYVRINGSYMS